MANPKKPKTYQQMSNELAGLVEWFEGGQVSLDEVASKYEEAMKLLEDMETYLKTAENKIKKITVKFDSE